jgi:hypothetical protein
VAVGTEPSGVDRLGVARLARIRTGPAIRAGPAAGALAVFGLASFLAFGLRLLLEPGAQYVGQNDDPQIFIWSLAWWPHAILHGQNPFVTTAVWAPSGIDTAWTTSTPVLALLLAPITLTLGPIAAYNAAAVLMPALAAWTCFLLCRRLTRSWWPSLAGGWLFGFSSYMLGHALAGHLHLTSVALFPLVALVLLDYGDGRIGRRGLLLRLGPLLAVQLLLSTELEAMLAIGLVLGLVVSAVVVPSSRAWIRTLPAPLVASYLFAALLTAPFTYYLLSDFQRPPLNPFGGYVADLANFVVPTRTELVARGWTGWTRFGGDIGEDGAFLGLPLIGVMVLFAVERGRSLAGRFLLLALGLTVLLALGPKLQVDGRKLVPLPWRAVEHVPVLDNVLSVRFTLFLSLVAAVITALWAATTQRARWLRIGLPLLAILCLLPDPVGQSWASTYEIPHFFTDARYRRCLDPGEVVLPLPISDRGQADLWQVASGFRFRMAGGRMLPHPPEPFLHPEAIGEVASGLSYPDQERIIPIYARAKGVQAVILDLRFDYKWKAPLDTIVQGQVVGGIRLYDLSPLAPSCDVP